MEEVKDVYRRSKIAIYSNSRPPLYNWPRFLEPYKYGCVGMVDYIAMSDDDFEKNPNIVRLVPKVKRLPDLNDLIPYYIDDINRQLLVNDVLNEAAVHSKVNITNFIKTWICLMEYMNAKKDYDLKMLEYNSEVIDICDRIIKCYQGLNDKKNIAKFSAMRDYFLNLLKDNYHKKEEWAYEYAYYYWMRGEYSRCLEIVNTGCPEFHNAMILKGRILGEMQQYRKAINALISFQSDVPSIESERLYFIGIALSREGNFKEAINYFKEIIKKYPAMPHLCEYLIGACYYNLDNMLEAKTWLQKAFEKAYTHYELAIMLGDTNFKLMAYDEAINKYNHALAVIRTKEKNIKIEIDIIERIAKAFLFKGDIMSAVNWLLYIIENYEGDNLDIHKKLFFIFLSQGMLFDKTIEMLNLYRVSLVNAYKDYILDLPDFIKDRIKSNGLKLNIQDTGQGKIFSDFKDWLLTT
jgi:tetratricopeptide (TPR) repeat protein